MENAVGYHLDLVVPSAADETLLAVLFYSWERKLSAKLSWPYPSSFKLTKKASPSECFACSRIVSVRFGSCQKNNLVHACLVVPFWKWVGIPDKSGRISGPRNLWIICPSKNSQLMYFYSFKDIPKPPCWITLDVGFVTTTFWFHQTWLLHWLEAPFIWLVGLLG